MSRHRILLDCDDILADFTGGMLRWISDQTGFVIDREDIDNWNVFDDLGIIHLRKDFDRHVKLGEFCYNLKVLPGAWCAVDYIRKHIGDVYIVTSPFKAPTWVYERNAWLNENFDISDERIIHAKSKYVVCGDALVDDSLSNLKGWKAAWPSGAAILKYVGTHGATSERRGINRVKRWDNVIRLLRNHVQSTKPVATCP